MSGAIAAVGTVGIGVLLGLAVYGIMVQVSHRWRRPHSPSDVKTHQKTRR